MKIIIQPAVLIRLLAYAAATRDEYSGFGFCRRDEAGDIVIYDFALLDVGDWAYTEIDPKRVLPLLQRPDRTNMKVWLHKHPLGNGIPGPHNWSLTDETTIRTEPVGSTPELIGWSVSVVLTPQGFVGRIDNYVKGITRHLEVEPATRNMVQEVWELAKSSPLSPRPSRGRKKKSSSSLDGQLPTQETRRAKAKTGGKMSSTSTTQTPTSPPTSPTSMILYGNYAGATIQLSGHLPIFATSGASTGSTNTGEPGDPTNTTSETSGN